MRKWEGVFIDRDGTIGGTGHFIHPKEFELYPFSGEALRLLKEHGIKTFACTNQHRIKLGQATINEFYDQFMSYGFDDAFICPHGPEDGCGCRKPQPGMLKEAAEKYNLNLKNTVFIGDVGGTDMLAAHRVGAKKVLVRTGWGEESMRTYRHTWAEAEPDYIAKDLLDAVKWVIQTDPV
ncbi:MAG: HAD-IIIA family hydrolase [Tuberibacillus sp.]